MPQINHVSLSLASGSPESEILAQATNFMDRGARAPSRAAVGALADCFFESSTFPLEPFTPRGDARRGFGRITEKLRRP